MHLIIHQILTIILFYQTMICSYLVIDTTLASDTPLCFIENLLKKILKLTMIIDDRMRDEKLQYNINREAAKI